LVRREHAAAAGRADHGGLRHAPFPRSCPSTRHSCRFYSPFRVALLRLYNPFHYPRPSLIAPCITTRGNIPHTILGPAVLPWPFHFLFHSLVLVCCLWFDVPALYHAVIQFCSSYVFILVGRHSKPGGKRAHTRCLLAHCHAYTGLSTVNALALAAPLTFPFTSSTHTFIRPHSYYAPLHTRLLRLHLLKRPVRWLWFNYYHFCTLPPLNRAGGNTVPARLLRLVPLRFY